MRLSETRIGKLSKRGRYPDGNNLYLNVSKAGTRSWLFRYVIGGKETMMGLGSFPELNLGPLRTLPRAGIRGRSFAGDP
jgi:hypothetical protein